MAQNCKTLRHLELGFETDAAMDFLLLPIANDDHADFAQSRSFERTLREECEALKASMSLNSLKVISWNVRTILSDKHWPTMDLRNLTKLVLEDCYALNEAFLLLSSFSTNPQDVRCLLNLDSFTFRQKYGPQCIRKHLRRFICSLPRGLRDLSVLMDEVGFNMSTESILRVHGKTLRTLIWDERSYRRETVQDCTTEFPRKDGVAHFSTISRACPELRELGLSLDWATVQGSNGNQTKVILAS